jgi:predicted DNA-binding protein (MmcQ/YjbR family)
MRTTEKKLRGFALDYPGATEHFPWGHRALKIKNKVFVFLALDLDAKTMSMSVKLPRTSSAALMLPFASPTGYGLGKSGWVTARFEQGDEIPTALLEEWIDESFRAIAPKKIVAGLERDGNDKPGRAR